MTVNELLNLQPTERVRIRGQRLLLEVIDRPDVIYARRGEKGHRKLVTVKVKTPFGKSFSVEGHRLSNREGAVYVPAERRV